MLRNFENLRELIQEAPGKKYKKSKVVAFCSILTALASVIMLVGALFGVLDMACAMLASFCVIFAIIEFGYLQGLSVYAASTVLTLLLGGISSAVFFGIFFGLYPILKSEYEHFQSRRLEWFRKILYFVILVFVSAIMMKSFVSEDAWAKLSPFVILIAVAVFISFIAYDVILTYMISSYIRTIRKKFGIERFLK